MISLSNETVGDNFIRANHRKGRSRCHRGSFTVDTTYRDAEVREIDVRKRPSGVFATSLLRGAAKRDRVGGGGGGQGATADAIGSDTSRGIGRSVEREGGRGDAREAGGGKAKRGRGGEGGEESYAVESSLTDASASSPIAHPASAHPAPSGLSDVSASAEIWRRAQRRSQTPRRSGSRTPSGHVRGHVPSTPRPPTELRVKRRPKMTHNLQVENTDAGMRPKSVPKNRDLSQPTEPQCGESRGEGDIMGVSQVYHGDEAEEQSFENITFAEFENWIQSRRKSRRRRAFSSDANKTQS